MPYIKDKRPETMLLEGEWNVGAYKYKAPHLLEEFVQGLKEKKLIGSMCIGCGKVIIPPRNICGRCHQRMEGRITVSNWGTVVCFVTSPPVEKGKFQVFGIDPVESGLIQEGSVLIPTFVRFDGADANIVTELCNVDPKDVFIGMRVKAIWAEEPQGQLSDLVGVEPI
ncbi:MAG: hypothetical protein JSU92_08800 [Deltaproteobacteria bacterium]|nr:MAG: hypothetical protein JSU92_08800 [Deltaproteobacteria bacterium]